MIRVARLTQMANHMVGMKIDKHTGKKQQKPRPRMGLQQISPTTGIHPFGSKVKQTASLHHSVQYIKYNAHHHNSYRHPAFSFQQKRKNKRPLEIV